MRFVVLSDINPVGDVVLGIHPGSVLIVADLGYRCRPPKDKDAEFGIPEPLRTAIRTTYRIPVWRVTKTLCSIDISHGD